MKSRCSREIIDAVVARLRIFPFKSLPGVDVSAATLTRGGGFSHDREFAMFDKSGYVNGKSDRNVHALRISYDEDVTRANFASALTGERLTFDLEDDPGALENYLSRHFERRISVRRACDGGFPDDREAPGPTVISTATLAAIATWFPGLDVGDMRLRLRTNIEIGDVPPFWEDRLYAGAGTALMFRVGEVTIEGTNPCQRCIVPARDPNTGSAIRGFAKRVAEQRAATLPAWADGTRFDHFYRLAVNTRLPALQTGRTMHVGDAVALQGAT